MARKHGERNPKVRATAAIWSMSVGMFAICIPLVAITGSGIILPLLVMLGAGASTAVVWLSPEQRRLEEGAVVRDIHALEARVRDLEAICTSLSPVDEARLLSETQK